MQRYRDRNAGGVPSLNLRFLPRTLTLYRLETEEPFGWKEGVAEGGLEESH